jgi:prephenate dehydratase
MNRMQIAIQGEIRSFHHIAAEKWAEEPVTIIPKTTFRDVFEALKQHETDIGVVAVSNSIYGSIKETADLLEEYQFPVIGEVTLKIAQHLIGLPESRLESITHVYSHPIALAQCRHYLDTYLPHAERISFSDTAAAVAYVKKQDDPSIAAIAGSVAAEYYGLPILAAAIQDDPDNATKFVVIRAR